MKKQKKPPSPKARFIVEILLSLIIPWCWIEMRLKGLNLSQLRILFISVLISAVLIVLSIFSYIKELRNNKKSRQSEDSFKDGSYFSSSEWRQNYLEYVQKHPFETPSSHGMKADLSARYRKRKFHYTWFLWFIAILLFALAIFLYYCLKDDDTFEDYAVPHMFFTYVIPGIAAILGVVVIRIDINFMKEDAVKNFYRSEQAAGNIDEIESSYANGKMLSHNVKSKGMYFLNGINIGGKYTVIYDSAGVYLIENSQILTVARNVIRYKSYYQELVYTGEEYQHKLYIMSEGNSEEYYVDLNEYQVEMALVELSKYAKHREENVIYEEEDPFYQPEE